jgi:hypothetical protein
MLTSTLSFTALSLFFLTFFSSSEPVSASFPHDLSRRQFGRLGQGRNNGGAGGAAAAGGAGCPPLTMIVARASTEAPGEGASLSLPLFPTRSDPRLSGIIGAVADGVKEQIPGAVSVRFLPLPCFLTLLFTLAGRRRLPRHSRQLRQLGSARSRRHVRSLPSSCAFFPLSPC